MHNPGRSNRRRYSGPKMAKEVDQKHMQADFSPKAAGLADAMSKRVDIMEGKCYSVAFDT